MEPLIPNLYDRKIKSAVKNLIIYSLTIIAVPLVSMFLLKRFFFEVILGYNAQDAILYSAIAAIVLVHIVLFQFVKVVYNSDQGQKAAKDD